MIILENYYDRGRTYKTIVNPEIEGPKEIRERYRNIKNGLSAAKCQLSSMCSYPSRNFLEYALIHYAHQGTMINNRHKNVFIEKAGIIYSLEDIFPVDLQSGVHPQLKPNIDPMIMKKLHDNYSLVPNAWALQIGAIGIMADIVYYYGFIQHPSIEKII